jgi:hypothetical protein
MAEQPKATPNIAQIETLLHAIRPEPGQRFHQRMAAATWRAAPIPNAGVFNMNTKKPIASGWVGRTAALAAVTLILIAVLAATPAGSVFASQIIQFFSRVQGNTVPLAPEQVAAPVPTTTPEPTYALALQPADQITQPAPTATAEPTPALVPLEDLGLREAEAAAGFDLYAPLHLPRDYRLSRVLYDPDQQAVSLWYASPQAGSGEFFAITQGKKLEPLSVGENATIETVPVGEYNAELVRGGWFVANGSSETVWEGGMEVYTLRWQAQEVTISIDFHLNETFSPAYLERDEMLAVAHDLARCVPADAACAMRQAAAAAGFTPWQFATLPGELPLTQVDYSPEQIALRYGSDMERVTLLQATQPFADEKGNAGSSLPAGAIQSVMVAGQPGEYVRGQFMAEPGQAEATWNPDAPVARLRWKNGETWLQITALGKQAIQLPQQLVTLAGQLTGDPAWVLSSQKPEDLTEPDVLGYYTSIAELETATGVAVREPGLLPAGLPFSHARYEPITGTVMFFYGTFAPDKMRMTGPVLIINQTPRLQNESQPSDYFPSQAIQAVTINGQPGQFVTGMMETSMAELGQPTSAPVWKADGGACHLQWRTDDWTFTIFFDPGYQRGERLTMQEMLKIAESLR